MKIYTEEIVPPKPATTRKVCKSRACDLCGLTAPGTEWATSTYEINETEIRVEINSRSGYSYPECGETTNIEVDLCPACFRDRLIPWLRSQGAKIDEKVIEF